MVYIGIAWEIKEKNYEQKRSLFKQEYLQKQAKKCEAVREHLIIIIGGEGLQNELLTYSQRKEKYEIHDMNSFIALFLL